MRDYTLQLTLTDDKVMITTDAGPTDCHHWINGKTYPLTHNASFADAPAGRYTLRLSLIDPKTKNPIALPLANGDAKKTYPLGTIAVQ
jgi:hypothetical protein